MNSGGGGDAAREAESVCISSEFGPLCDTISTAPNGWSKKAPTFVYGGGGASRLMLSAASDVGFAFLRRRVRLRSFVTMRVTISSKMKAPAATPIPIAALLGSSVIQLFPRALGVFMHVAVGLVVKVTAPRLFEALAATSVVDIVVIDVVNVFGFT